MAGLGAPPAVVVRVARALVAARLAEVGAEAADGGRALAAARHRRRGELAGGGAIEIERDAARHHLDVLLLQARRRAVMAGRGAGVAGVDAVLVARVRHGGPL